eukprot:1316253-Amorphochlora_amoeboformis.AAC.1
MTPESIELKYLFGRIELMMAVQRCAWGRASSLGRSRRGISRQHRQMLALTHGCPAGVPFARGLSMLAEPQESKFMPRE